MRFDKHIKLITLSTEADGLGGRTEVENVIIETMCNFEELSLETTVKIYGEAITQNAKAIILGSSIKIDKVEIDDINILQATFLAMRRAVEMLASKPDLLLIDGNRTCDFGIPAKTVVHGDSLSASIAAASVLAKVTRDDYMLQQAEIYPEYGFDIHKGYGTKAHYAALETYGHCPIHRMSFLRKFYGTK